MRDELLGHSGRAAQGIPAQAYWEHVGEVARGAEERAAAAAQYWRGDRARFVEEVRTAGEWHDCGKLCQECQTVMRRSEREALPVDHTDAGAGVLLRRGREIAGMLVRSHHRPGLPSVPEEKLRIMESPPGRPFRNRKVMAHTEEHLAEYVAEQERCGVMVVEGSSRVNDWSGLTHRIALACLVDADHSDTARHYREVEPARAPGPRWDERLTALDRYVSELGERGRRSARGPDRAAMYEACRKAPVEPGLRACEAPVGTGKTTAIMAHLLRAAQQKGLRHILVVLPYTNIIRQSVEKYREALVLEGERPEEVVAELDHQAEFQSVEARHMAALWDAPITVTTAVQFFETLAGREPARVRKLHELPGSGVFIDEEHTALPAWLWPQTWLWVKELVGDWGCHVVLGSGSLARFWRVKGLVEEEVEVPELLPEGLRSRLLEVERVRVAVRRHERPMGVEELAGFVKEREGPRLVILNTVQNAAVLADRMRKEGEDVMHLSTALAPVHRRAIVDRIRERLKERDDKDWGLVATSCVEAGLDFSFRSAVRESCSVASAIQTGGRTNREGEWAGGEVWDVRLSDRVFSKHPGFERSRRVLEEMLEEGELERMAPAEAVTEAVIREVLRHYPREAEELKKLERRYDFAGVAEKYRVIEGETRTVVVPGELMRKLEARERVGSREILMGSVQMWGRKIEKLAVQEFGRYPGLYRWNGRYEEDFLGYMVDVLPLVYAGEIQAHLV